MEEERRLCYVGVTRAMKELYLLAVRWRRIYGREEARWPSRFLGELPDTIVGAMPGTEALRAEAPRPTVGGTRSHPSAAASTSARRVTRGGDDIVYDEDHGHRRRAGDDEAPRGRDPFEDDGPAWTDDEGRPQRLGRSPASPARSAFGGGPVIARGSRVVHNTVRSRGASRTSSATGPQAHSRSASRPESATVIARFVRSRRSSVLASFGRVIPWTYAATSAGPSMSSTRNASVTNGVTVKCTATAATSSV
jgi:hypothetical protein